jgi:hypothetical protein
MSTSEPKPAQTGTVEVCAIAFLVIGLSWYQVLAPRLIPKPQGGGFGAERIVWATIVGAVSAGLGAAVGKLINRMRSGTRTNRDQADSADRW